MTSQFNTRAHFVPLCRCSASSSATWRRVRVRRSPVSALAPRGGHRRVRAGPGCGSAVLPSRSTSLYFSSRAGGLGGESIGAAAVAVCMSCTFSVLMEWALLTNETLPVGNPQEVRALLQHSLSLKVCLETSVLASNLRGVQQHGCGTGRPRV